MDVRRLEDEQERRAAVPILRQLWTDADPAAVLEWTGADDYHCCGGFVDGDLVGVAGVLQGEFLHHTRHAWLYDLVIDDPRRGEGYGTELLEFVERWAAERDCEYVALASPQARGDVHDYYESRGYERWGYVIETEL
ncbi:GNAT family N-acetyltransferase [Halopiger goleimassiliensis]|uniref:GNAT family N-acetyltransferase n=1 Tax=Halopiger goleimassiliensis TaxID=1293048 RepID=UPI0006777AE1|nr:GNAT family N-acetyltransferase [Halopiger goleimassiliensis]